MAYCIKAANRMAGDFYEISEDAGSFRGEQLGRCAIYHLVAALYMFYNIKTWHTRVNCDIQGDINMAERNLGRIRPGCSCADILRNLLNTVNKMSTAIKYQHVDSHMDTYLLWKQFSLEQILNVMYETLAKRVVSRTR